MGRFETADVGDSVSEAQENAYKLVKMISWQDMFFRTDIAYRAVARERQK